MSLGLRSALGNDSGLTLVIDGQPNATIILSPQPSAAASFAAEELSTHIEQITGVRLPIKNDKAAVSGIVISIGDTELARAAKLTQETTPPREVVIRTKANEIILYGKDAEGNSEKRPEPFDERGSLDATYEFLERYCGVRWYHPTELGTVVPRQKNLAVPLVELKFQPSMSYLWIAQDGGIWLPRKIDHLSADDVNLWYLRMRMGGEKYAANHSFLSYYDRFLKSHPEYFSEHVGSQRPAQLCYANPDVVDQIVKDANNYFDGKGLEPAAFGLGDYFGIVPMDSAWWCRCEDCLPLFAKHVPKEEDKYFSNGKSSIYYWTFANKVAAELRKSHPEKYLSTLAYMDYAEYPENGMELEPNLSVQLCIQTRLWIQEGLRDHERKILKTWANQSKQRPLFLWLYYCFPALSGFYGKFDIFPGYSGRHVIEWMKSFHEAEVRGLFLEHSSEFRQSHLLDLPDLYLTMRLGRDKTLDGRKLYDEFFRLYFGAASKPMQQLYEEIEDVYWDAGNYPDDFVHQTEEIAWGSLGTPERMAKWLSLIDKASTLASGPKEKERLQAFIAGVWEPMVAGAKRHPILSELKNLPIPEADIPSVPPADGDPQKVDWSLAYQTGAFRQMSGETAQTKVSASLAHDGNYLYIKFEDETVGAKLLNVEDGWGDEFRIVVASARGGITRSLAVLPDGKKIHESATNEGDGLWRNEAKIISVHRPGEPWTLYVALPLEKLLPGGATLSKPFYLNLGRITQGQIELLGWSVNFKSDLLDSKRLPEVRLQ